MHNNIKHERKAPIKSYADFNIRLKSIILRYKLLLFSLVKTFEYFTPEQIEDFEPSGVTITDSSQCHTFDIWSDDLFNEINNFCVDLDRDFLSATMTLTMRNMDLIRKGVINECYECISNYLEVLKKDRTNGSYLKGLLKKEEWFKVLTILRNNASHYDNRGKTDNYADGFKNQTSFKFNTIEITKGVLGHQIRYSDKEVIELLSHCVKYFEDNKSTFDN